MGVIFVRITINIIFFRKEFQELKNVDKLKIFVSKAYSDSHWFHTILSEKKKIQLKMFKERKRNFNYNSTTGEKNVM